MRKFSLSTAGLLAAVSIILAVGTTGAKAETLTFAHGFAPNMSWAKAAEKFKEVVEEETNGELTVEIYDSGVLGEQRQLIEQIIDSGTNDLTITLEPLSFWVPEINLYQMPYLFRDTEHLIQFEEGSVGEKLKNVTKEKTDLRILSYFPRASRQLSTTDTKVESIEDVQGLKIRVTQSKAAIAAWEAIGAKPVPMPWGEVFTALRQGVLDAQENPFPHMVSRKTYEVTPYGARTNHAFASVWLVMSEGRYNDLPEEWQAAVDKAAQAAHDHERSIASKEAAEAVETLKENGMVITEPDLAPFRKRAKQAYSQFPDLLPWIEDIQAIR